jgi:hypothetical protein
MNDARPEEDVTVANPVLSTPQLVRVLKELLASDHVITDQGAGANLIEVLSDLTRSIDRIAAAMEHYNRRRDEER